MEQAFKAHKCGCTEGLQPLRYFVTIPGAQGLVPAPEEFPYSSANLMLDEVPQGLKPAA